LSVSRMSKEWDSGTWDRSYKSEDSANLISLRVAKPTTPTQTDFEDTRSQIDEIIERTGHRIIFYPISHTRTYIQACSYTIHPHVDVFGEIKSITESVNWGSGC